MSTPTLSILADSSQIRTATKDLQSLSSAGGDTEKSVIKTSDAVKRFNAEMAVSGRTVTSTNKVIGFLGQEIDSATKELQSLIAESNRSNAVLQSVESNLTKLTTASKSAAASASAFADALTTVNQDLGVARANIENFISDQIKFGRTIDENGNVLSASGAKMTELSEDLQRLKSEYLNTSNQADELADSMSRITLATDKNQAAAYEARLKQMALADAAQDVSSAFKAQNATLKHTETEYSRLVARANGANRVMGDSGKVMRSLGRNAGMAGIQVQQFVGQIQGGQSALLALSQQGADLGFVLGAPLVGAIVGIGASLVSFLIPALINSSEETETLAEKLKELGETQLLTAEQAAFLADVQEDGIKKNKGRQAELEKEIAIVKSAIRNQEIAIGKNQEQEGTIENLKEANEASRKELRKLQADYSLLNTEIEKSEKTLKAYDLIVDGTTKLTDDQRESIDSLKQSYMSQIVALQDGAQAAEVYAAEQRAIKDGTEEQLPEIIALINRKYELKRAQEEAAEAAKTEAAAQRQLEKDYQSFLRRLAEGEALRKRQEEQDAKSFANLKQQLVLQQQQFDLTSNEFELRRNLLALGEDDGSELYQKRAEEITALTGQLQAVRFEAELVGRSLEQSMGDIGVNALDSVSQGLASIITQGESAREVFHSIANTILNELLTAVIRYAIGAAAQSIIGTTTASAASVAAGATVAAAWTPAAIAASIATAGGATTAGVAAISAGAPIAAGAIKATSLAGFESGGYTGNVGTSSVAGVVHGQEYVMPADVTRRNRPALEAMHRGESIGGDTYVNVVNNSSNTTVETQESTNSDGARVVDIVVADINRRGRIHQSLVRTTTANNRL